MKLAMIFLFILSATVQATVQVDSPAMVRVKSKAQVGKIKIVTLGDVAEVTGLSEDQRKQIVEITLSDAPPIGEERTLTSQALLSILREPLSELEKTLDRKIHLVLPRDLTVTREQISPTAEVIRDLLIKQWSEMCADCEFRIGKLQLPLIPSSFHLSSWNLKISEKWPSASFNIPLEVVDEENRSRVLWVIGNVQIYREVPRTLRAISYGERIGVQDFEIAKDEITYAQDSFPGKSDVVGSRLKRPLRAHQVIGRSDLEKEKFVRRGQAVKALAKNTDWEISIDGISENDGQEGDYVNVKNPKTQKVLSGRVVGPGQVEIE